jgi:hypothetical protein
MDRRGAWRLPYDAFAEDIGYPRSVVLRRVRDLGPDGLFLEDRLGTVEAPVRLRVPAPDGSPVEVAGEIVRRTAIGVGVRFVQISPADRARLRAVR